MVIIHSVKGHKVKFTINETSAVAEVIEAGMKKVRNLSQVRRKYVTKIFTAIVQLLRRLRDEMDLTCTKVTLGALSATV